MEKSTIDKDGKEVFRSLWRHEKLYNVINESKQLKQKAWTIFDVTMEKMKHNEICC